MRRLTPIALALLVILSQVVVCGDSITAAQAQTLLQPQAHGPTIKQFDDLRHGGAAHCIVSQDDSLWVTDSFDQDSFGASLVVQISSTGKRIGELEYPVDQYPNGSFIATGPARSLWVTDQYDGTISRFAHDGALTQFSVSNPGMITQGPDGNMWFTPGQYGETHSIEMITGDGTVTVYTNGITGTPLDITAGPDGALWFTEEGRIGRITTSGSVTEYSMGIPAGAQPFWITLGPDGNLWFTEHSVDAIARITPTGVVSQFHEYRLHSIYAIAPGPDQALWFTRSPNIVGRITTHGAVEQFSRGIPSNALPTCITKGSDGHMWFVESNLNMIARIVL